MANWIILATLTHIALAQNPLGLPFVGDACKRDNPCESSAKCITDPAAPVVGRAICLCPEGFSGDGRKDGSGCSDINECQLGTDNCDRNSESCENTSGSYNCSCKSGFQRYPGHSHCMDINECVNPFICGDPLQTTCHNTEGSYSCLCKDNHLEYVNGKCLQKDICTSHGGVDNPCDRVHGICVSGAEGVDCICKAGFELADDGVTCVDIDECASGLHTCPANISKCVNEIGSYHCQCSHMDGYTNADPYSCTNLNECEFYPDICPGDKECCMDLPPPRKYVCSNKVSKQLDGGQTTENSSIAPRLLPTLFDLGLPTLGDLFDVTNGNGPSSFLSVLKGALPGVNLRQLSEGSNQTVGEIVLRRAVEAAAAVAPRIQGDDQMICPRGFIDLGMIKRRHVVEQIPQDGARWLNVFREISPVKVEQLNDVEPAAVAVGIANNAKYVADQVSDWYKTLSSVTDSVGHVTGQIKDNFDIKYDLQNAIEIANHAAKPFLDAYESVNSLSEHIVPNLIPAA